ncbi:MAG: hypothetical protein JKX70_04675 [Phycisphaerales bacterium]|nr:hypothetical protein [Phycisphaerales bacterium]
MFVYPNIHQRGRFCLISLLIGSLFLSGCGGDEVRDENDSAYYTDRSRAVFAPELEPSAKPMDSDQAVQAGTRKNIGGWTIVLLRVEQGGMARATEMLRVIRDEAGVNDAFIDRRSSGLVIAYGDYLDKREPQAIRDLERMRSVQLMGVTLFESAIIVPPTSESLMGSNPAYDLRRVKARFGKKAVYTLQIGLYGRSDYQAPSAEDLVAFRKAAEDAVRILRGQGELAFYYHAPARSMVTVGVFSERDFDATTRPPTQSRAMRELREKFPNNLLNGQGINETIRTESGKTTRLQSSQLVAIPEK